MSYTYHHPIKPCYKFQIVVFKALKMIENVSCIRFRPQREVQHYDHIEFVSGRGCYTQIGRSGYGKQEIVLRPECAKVGSHLILHEARDPDELLTTGLK